MPPSSSSKYKSLLESASQIAERLEVTCIERSEFKNHQECTKSIGGAGWRISQLQAIEKIRNNPYAYFVKNKAGKEVYLEIVDHNGTPYLKTQKDDEDLDNLLRLGLCP